MHTFNSSERDPRVKRMSIWKFIHKKKSNASEILNSQMKQLIHMMQLYEFFSRISIYPNSCFLNIMYEFDHTCIQSSIPFNPECYVRARRPYMHEFNQAPLLTHNYIYTISKYYINLRKTSWNLSLLRRGMNNSCTNLFQIIGDLPLEPWIPNSIQSYELSNWTLQCTAILGFDTST